MSIKTARHISFTQQSKPLAELVQEHNVKFAAWDFDGTAADTERLHRVTFRLALNELSGARIPKSVWLSKPFQAGFGLPELETCLTIAKALETHSAEHKLPWFKKALAASPDHGEGFEPTLVVARGLCQRRGEIFDYYVKKATVSTSHKPGTPTKLAILSDATSRQQLEAERLEFLKPVQVKTYPFVREVIHELAKHDIDQGVCTSSSKRFVKPLLRKLGLSPLIKDHVFADCVPAGYHKPDPFPWKLLRARLANQFTIEHLPTTDDMLRFENSAGGGLSSILSGRGPTIITAENNASVMGKLHQKINGIRAKEPNSPIPGQALFVPDLGSLLPEKRS
jgi:beta-phosphoglucomutase-like phosphatase (HAD superfamily)